MESEKEKPQTETTAASSSTVKYSETFSSIL